MTQPAKAGVLVLLLVVLLLFVAFSSPRVSIPVVSKFVCSLGGGTWTDGSVAWGIPAGCYAV